jgi:hypothetical protein
MKKEVKTRLHKYIFIIINRFSCFKSLGHTYIKASYIKGNTFKEYLN